MSKLDIAVYGSCVARDVVRVASESLELRSYFARSSWISATNPAVDIPGAESALSSAFQQRMLENDFSSSALRRAVNTQSDVLVLDLVDERLGVYPVNRGGYLTWLNELNHSGWLKCVPHGPLIEFGTDEHFSLFKSSAQIVSSTVELEKTVLLRFNFAEASREGQAVPETKGKPAKWWNEQYARYYDAAADEGIAVIEVPSELCVSTEQHLWGIAQYHFVNEFYEWVSLELARRFSTDPKY